MCEKCQHEKNENSIMIATQFKEKKVNQLPKKQIVHMEIITELKKIHKCIDNQSH